MNFPATTSEGGTLMIPWSRTINTDLTMNIIYGLRQGDWVAIIVVPNMSIIKKLQLKNKELCLYEQLHPFHNHF
jgi:hypothetical protein